MAVGPVRLQRQAARAPAMALVEVLAQPNRRVAMAVVPMLAVKAVVRAQALVAKAVRAVMVPAVHVRRATPAPHR